MFSELILFAKFAAVTAAVLFVCSLVIARELRSMLDVIDEEHGD